MRLRESRNILLVIVFSFLLTHSALANCDKPAITSKNATVYDDVPQFYTGQGWVMGKKVKDLSKGSQIWICAERTVGFLVGRKPWLQISEGKDRPPIGWIFGEDADKSASRSNPSLSLIPTAEAQDIKNASPVPAPANPVAVLSFFAMVLGMMAKELFDRAMGTRLKMKSYLRRLLPALVISPVVFSAMLQANIPIPDNKGLAALLAWAFQNGFFWQSLVKPIPAQKERVSRSHTPKGASPSAPVAQPRVDHNTDHVKAA